MKTAYFRTEHDGIPTTLTLWQVRRDTRASFWSKRWQRKSRDTENFNRWQLLAIDGVRQALYQSGG